MAHSAQGRAQYPPSLRGDCLYDQVMAASKGVAGGEDERVGVAACDGAFLLHSVHLSLVALIVWRRFLDGLLGGALGLGFGGRVGQGYGPGTVVLHLWHAWTCKWA